MNERLKLISDTEVTIERHEHKTCLSHLAIKDGQLLARGAGWTGVGRWDDDGLRALIEAANCKLQTGSFAMEARVAEDAIKKVMKRCGIPEPTA